MIEFIKGFFREGTPESMMRLLCFMSVVTACILAFTKNPDGVIIGSFLAAGIAGKVTQKSKE